MKGIQDIKDIVEIDKAWKEEYGTSVGVALAEIIYPKRISGVKAYQVQYKSEVLANHLGIACIPDKKCNKHIQFEGCHIRSNEIEKLKFFIVVKGIIIPPMHSNLNGKYMCDLFCSVHKDKNAPRNENFLENDPAVENDQAVFQAKRIMPQYFREDRITNINFTVVFGFSEFIRFNKINIFPDTTTGYDVFSSSITWFKNNAFFKGEVDSIKNNKDFYCKTYPPMNATPSILS